MALGEISRRALGRLRQFATQRLERHFGLRTWGTIWQREAGYAYGLYRPTSWLVLNALFGDLEVAEDDVFADIGSGMGRAVFVAARRPFKRVIGIERAQELTEIARENIRRNEHRLTCTDIELHTIDALEWDVPDDLTVVYLCCPFPDEVLERFVLKLTASLSRRPRPLRLIYYFGTEQNKQVILGAGRVAKISFRVRWYLRTEYEEVSMFRLLPGDGELGAADA